MSNNSVFGASENDFEKWWLIYPRKVCKADARKTWEKLKRKGILPTLDCLIPALERAKATDQWQRRDASGQLTWVPHAATYLNREQWADCFDSMAATTMDAIWEAATCKSTTSQH
jgi:hypothetical protein